MTTRKRKGEPIAEPTPRAGAAPERWQHGQEPELHEGTQRVASTVAALRKSGRLDDADVVAAERYYSDFALSAGARDPEQSGSGGGQEGFSGAVIDAMTRTNEARRALGPLNAALVNAVVVNGFSILRMSGGLRGKRAVTVAGEVAEALKELTEHYAAADRAAPNRARSVAPHATKGA